MKTTTWVWLLEETIQNEIKSDVTNALMYIEDQEERNEAIENAMDSRLCDLEDTIDISKYA